MLRHILAGAALLAALAAPALFAPPTFAQAAPVCTYELGFKTLNDLIPGIAGDCLDNEQHNAANGDGLQHTTRGLMAWRTADNWTAFTDGNRTWINGPGRLAPARFNTERYGWEANPNRLPLVRGSWPPSANTAGHAFYASAYRASDPRYFDAHVLYCDTDPGWRSLSPTYLANYSDLASARAALPEYALHAPC